MWVVTGAAYGELTRQALPELPLEHLVIEPSAKNTAPALALVAGHLSRRYGDAAVLVLPADHYIPDVGAFAEAADRALATAATCEGLVTFGVEPTRPETQYGYIELDEPATRAGGEPGMDRPVSLRVRRFVEKPGPEQAAAFLASGRYLWNSGMFAWRNAVFRAELEAVAPELARLARRVAAGEAQAAWEPDWHALPAISVDYAVLERARSIYCIRAGFAWDDLGSWLAVDRHGPRDAHGNVVLGGAPAVVQRSSGVTVLAEDVPAVVMGVRDLILAATRDGVLVAGKDSLAGLRQALDALAARLREAERPCGPPPAPVVRRMPVTDP